MTPYYDDGRVQLWHGQALDCARELADGSVSTIVTSPPYFGLRDYGVPGQLGNEATVEEYVEKVVAIFHELRRVLADDGTLWLNLGDTYQSSGGSIGVGPNAKVGNTKIIGSANRVRVKTLAPNKSLLGIPWRVAFALQDDGWILRSDIIWAKPNPMPESVTDRPTKSYEHVFLFAKSEQYFYDAEAIAEPVSDSTTARLSQNIEAQAGSGRVLGKTNGTMKAVGGRPQLRRARELAAAGGLTDEHMAAIRAVGITDTGKATTTQNGTGKNTERMKELAAEAKLVLGGYYREFLVGDTRNARDVWSIPTMPFSAAHFAVFPEELPRRCIRAGAKPGGTVLDPFSGSGTTGKVALMEGHPYIGFDLSSKYLDLSLRERFAQQPLDLGGFS